MDGIIIINKEKEYTSHDIVAKVKKILKVSKVGHTGTLDPNATGVLPVLVGKGTKLSAYFINHDKEYVATLQLGERTTTQDGEGEVIETCEVPKLITDIVKKVLNSFVGESEQIPPMYSAIKIKGKKLYEYARQKQEVEIPPRKIKIYSICLLEIRENQIVFQVHCSKGTYIRSLCEDIAKKLGTVGYMKELCRTRVGDFKIEKAMTLAELEANKDNELFLQEKMMTFENIFQDRMELSEKELVSLKNGVKILTVQPDGLYKIYNQQQELIGIGKIEKGILKREIFLKE